MHAGLTCGPDCDHPAHCTGVPKSSIVLEKNKGLRPGNRTRPGDIGVLDLYGLGRHLVIDAVLCTVYRNKVILAQGCSIPGYAAKMPDDRKFYNNDKTSTHPVSSKYGGDHVFVPFAMMEDWGTLGAHALAL